MCQFWGEKNHSKMVLTGAFERVSEIIRFKIFVIVYCRKIVIIVDVFVPSNFFIQLFPISQKFLISRRKVSFPGKLSRK
jgi:hypothetical protein